MALESGTRLGPYKVVSQVGAGGMGEVYKATDTRLDRTVAIKVLPERLASDSSRRERFEREARAVSSLNHPHICTLHDVGEQDGTHYLVMELVEGETLESRLQKGRLPLDQALEYAIQIADALDKAHRQGVVHRDLKPGNIMVTKAGVKLLDFGLAKLKGDAAPTSGLSQAPTKENLTAEGTIIGTLQYMAPEQLEGEEADGRTDIFALGSVLYEMVTGNKAFGGKSQASLIGAIMNAAPQPMSELEQLTPRPLDRVVGKCLSKEPDARWQTASDLCDELRWIGSGTDEPLTPTAAASVGTGRVWQVSVAVLLVIAVFSTIVALRDSPVAERQLMRTQLELASPGIIEAGYSMSFSPDGSQLLFVASGDDGVDRLFIHDLGLDTTRVLDGTEGARAPFFSPDGSGVGFVVDVGQREELRRIRTSGGGVVPLSSDVPYAYAGDWGSGYIVGGSTVGTLWRVPENGGDPEPLTSFISDGDNAHRFPQILPGGDAILFTNAGTANPSGYIIEVVSLEDQQRKELVEGGTFGRYLPSGHLVYVRDNALYARTFDVRRLEVGDQEVQVLQGIDVTLQGVAQMAFSRDGHMAYRPTDSDVGMARLEFLNDTGQFEAIPGIDQAIYQTPMFSPDGDQLAVVIDDGGGYRDLWVYDFDRMTWGQRTFNGQIARATFDWSTDGRFLIYGAEDGIAWVRADRVSDPQPLLSGAPWSPTHVSFDGDWVIGVLAREGTLVDIWRAPLDTSGSEPQLGEPVFVLETPALETSPMISPDGEWLVYDLGGLSRVRSMSGTEEWPLGGRQSVWSASTNEVFYTVGDLAGIRIDSVEYEIEDGTFTIGDPVARSPEGEIMFAGLATPYDVHPDGNRWLAMREPDSQSTTRVMLVVDFVGELERLVASD